MTKSWTLCLASMIIGAMAGFSISQKMDECPYEGTWHEVANARLEMIIAQDELLHEVFTDNKDYWYDVLMEGDAYLKLDSIREGDWEDFYYY